YRVTIRIVDWVIITNDAAILERMVSSPVELLCPRLPPRHLSLRCSQRTDVADNLLNLRFLQNRTPGGHLGRFPDAPSPLGNNREQMIVRILVHLFAVGMVRRPHR